MSQFDFYDEEFQIKSTYQNTNQLLDLSFEKDTNINDKNDLTQFNIFVTEPNNSEKDELSNSYLIQHNNIISQPTIPKIKQMNNQKILLGRKRKDSGQTGKHDKYAENNMIRKIKVIIKNDILDLINNNIKKYISKIDINNKIYENIKLLNINQSIIIDTTVNGNKKFLNKKIREIFSENISKNYSSFPPNFNALLIEKIYSMENTENIISIFEKKVLECLKYYRKDEDVINDPNYECLTGLEKGFEALKEKIMMNNDEKYADKLIKLIKEFEVIYCNKKARAKKVKNIDNN